MKTKILIILGPTAVGKSDLAVQLAQKWNGEIISADSRQVYKGMDIGTGKISIDEMAGIKHYLLDVADPKDTFNVTDFVKLGEQAIQNISQNGKLPIVCGGSGFYIDALIDGIILPEVKADTKLRAELKDKTAEELLLRLKKLDPVRASEIDPENTRRLIRAIEIASSLGSVPKVQKSSDRYDTLFIGLNVDRALLRQRIMDRLIKRLDAGMVQEVENLHKNGLSYERMDELGLEYRHVSRFIQGKITREEMVTKLHTEICRYAKRQMTWFNRNKSIKWFEPRQVSEIKEVVKGFIDTN